MRNGMVSLVGTTRGNRNDSISRLLDSIENTENTEIVFVDQTGELLVEKLFESYEGRVRYKLLKSAPCSLSDARNMALGHVEGDVVGFCDDDAFYEPDFFEKLLEVRSTRNCEVICCPVLDKNTMSAYGGRPFPHSEGIMSYLEILRCSLSVGTFVDVIALGGLRFNPLLGVGARYGGSEETDFILGLKANGLKVQFEPSIHVYHDNDQASESIHILAKKYYSYAVGYALVLKKFMRASNFTLLLEFINIIVRSALGVLLSRNRRVHYFRLKGLIKGLTSHKL